MPLAFKGGAAIGFTVSLFVASVAFETGPVQDAAKMGALFAAFCDRNADAIKANPEQAVAAFRAYCLDAENKGAFVA